MPNTHDPPHALVNLAPDAARELVEKRLASAPGRGSYVEIPTDELPRRVPQDPEAVRNEQEARRLQAKLEELQKQQGPPPVESLHKTVQELERRLAILETVIREEFGEGALADGWPS